jgi:hypothetical protein
MDEQTRQGSTKNTLNDFPQNENSKLYRTSKEFSESEEERLDEIKTGTESEDEK